MHQSDIRFELVKSAKVYEFELNCLCSKYESKHVGLFFNDILVYNTFFEKPVVILKHELDDSKHVKDSDYAFKNSFYTDMMHLFFCQESNVQIMMKI